jgi:hypothetical protein
MSAEADADAPAAGLGSGAERRAVMLKRLSAPAPAPGEDKAETSWRNSPEDWLAHVDDLVGAGDEGRARAEMAAFREAWPDYPLDERHEALLEAADGSDAGAAEVSEPQ